MKILSALLLILTWVLLPGCGPQKPAAPNRPSASGSIKTESREVGAFQAVHIGGNITADITVGEGFGVTLEGDDNIVDMMKTEVENEMLRIDLKQKLSRDIRVKVTISMPALRELEVISTSTANVKGVKSDSLVLRAIAGSKITISGEAARLEAHAAGVSAIDAEALRTQTAEVEAVGATAVVVFPAVSLKATTAGSATVTYTGNPKVEKNSSDSSTVKKKG